MKKIILYAALMYMLPATAGVSHESNNARSEAVRQYTSLHIIPVLLEKRKVFDVFLNADEQNKLADCREQLHSLRKNFQAAMNQRSEAATQQSESRISPQDRKINHEKIRELMKQVRLIADNHKEELDKIMKDLAPQREQWKNDIAQIRASQQDEETAAAVSPKHDWVNNNRFKMRGRLGFLLLNSMEAANDNSEKRNSMSDVLPASSLEGMSIYPNPATDQFSLSLPGNPVENKLVITDVKGTIVSERENVLSSETISCTNFENGIYFIQLTSGNEVVNKKLVVNR